MSISKQQIIDTASVLFQVKGYKATSMEDISNELGVNKAALYYYIKNKESILYDICNQAMNTVEPGLKEVRQSSIPAVEKIRQIISRHLLAIIEETPILTVFFNERYHLSPEHLSSINQRRRNYELTIAEIFYEGIETGFIKSIDVLVVVYGILGMCDSINKWYKPEGRLKPTELTKVYSDLILEGCLNRK